MIENFFTNILIIDNLLIYISKMDNFFIYILIIDNLFIKFNDKGFDKKLKPW